MIPRFHLFEIEDFSWFPAGWRSLLTDYLRFLQERFGLYDAALELLQDLLNRGRVKNIVDLCSGSGGPLLHLIKQIDQSAGPISLTLTDKYPPTTNTELNSLTGTQNIYYFMKPVDARKVPPELLGLRTIFTSFHHFKPGDALRILQDASSSGIAIFEISDRTILGFARVAALSLAAPLFAFLIRPFSWKRILWSVLPVVPFLTFWDGTVSHMRSYTVPELKQLLEDSGCSGRGRVGTIRSGLGAQITYLIIDPA